MSKETFVTELEKIINTPARLAVKDRVTTVEVMNGTKFNRVVVVERVAGVVINRCAYAFIEVATGNLYKPDGWKGPAKNVVRGNINDDSWRPWCGPYGIASAK